VDFYRYPALYDLLRQPSEIARQSMCDIVQHYVGDHPYSIFEPGCGTGAWLSTFGGNGHRLVGLDIIPEMVTFARERLTGPRHLVVEGDMFALPFEEGEFDVIMEMSGVIGHIEEAGQLADYLNYLERFLTPRGIIMFTMPFVSGWETSPGLFFENEAPLGDQGARARVEYHLLGENGSPNAHRIRRRVLVSGAPELPAVLEDEYTIKSWTPEEFTGIRAKLENLSMVGAYDIDKPFDPERQWLPLDDEITLVFKTTRVSAPVIDLSLDGVRLLKAAAAEAEAAR